MATAIAASPAFQDVTGTHDAGEARQRIVADDGSSVEIVRDFSKPYPTRIDRE